VRGEILVGSGRGRRRMRGREDEEDARDRRRRRKQGRQMKNIKEREMESGSRQGEVKEGRYREEGRIRKLWKAKEKGSKGGGK